MPDKVHKMVGVYLALHGENNMKFSYFSGRAMV